MTTFPAVANFICLEPALTLYESACVMSFVRNGFRVRVWSYGSPVLPVGAEAAPAAELFPPEQHGASPARLREGLKQALVAKGEGWWFDTLVLCCRPAAEWKAMHQIGDGPSFAESEQGCPGEGVIRLPRPGQAGTGHGNLIPSSSYVVMADDRLDEILQPENKGVGAAAVRDLDAFRIARASLAFLGIPQSILPPPGSHLHDCLSSFISGACLEIDTLNTLKAGSRSRLMLNWLQQQFALFSPNSGGDAASRFNLTMQCVITLLPVMERALPALEHRSLSPMTMESMCRNEREQAAVAALGELFVTYGSDKATLHNYHCLYGHILGEPRRISSILEIGMGTNNPDVVSNMGVQGRPGASLRAFRDFLPHALVYGADVDRRILFSEDRIRTFFVDQLDPAALSALGEQLPENLDLIIDDGLHAPDANLNTLAFALPRVRVGGWIVIEDIAPAALPFWQVVAALIPGRFEKYILRGRAPNGWVFALKRLS